METIISKDILRKNALKKRKELYKTGLINKISKEITDKILSLELYKTSKNIALYYPLKGEVDLLALLKDKSKNFFFPKCKDEFTIEFCPDINDFSKGLYNIMEPKSNKVNPDILDIIFTPALLANSSCHRIGFGKGCYDRFFSENENNLKAKKIIVIPSFFISDEFEKDEFDIQCDIVLSEKDSFAKN